MSLIPSKVSRSLTKFLRLLKDGFWSIVAAYLLLVMIYVICFIVYKKNTYAFFAAYFDDTFGSSFSASFLEDLFVFTFLGLVVTIVSSILSYKNPDDYDYETRLSALLNSDSASGNKKLRSFIDSEFKSLLGFNKKVTVKLVIQEYRPTDLAYNIYAELEHTIHNAVKDLVYSPQKARRVQADSDLQVEGTWGYIKQLKVCDLQNNEIADYLKGPIKRLTASRYEQDIELHIPGNNGVIWSFYHEVWHKIGDGDQKGWYAISVSRYTQEFELIIENNGKFDRVISYDVNLYKYLSNSLTSLYKDMTLRKGEQRKHKVKSILHPQDRVNVYVHQPQQKDAIMKNLGGGGTV